MLMEGACGGWDENGSQRLIVSGPVGTCGLVGGNPASTALVTGVGLSVNGSSQAQCHSLFLLPADLDVENSLSLLLFIIDLHKSDH